MTNRETLDYLINLRKEYGLTQNDIAENTGILRPNIARIEKARNDPSLDVLIKYASALGYEIELNLISKSLSENKQIGIGYQNFEEVIFENVFYIDKSLFIKEWWDSKDKITLITRPRRFGKTLNLSMLDRFFSLSYKDDKDCFTNLKISTVDSGKFNGLQNSYPVIFLSFAGVKATNYEDAVNIIKYEISDICGQMELELHAQLALSVKDMCAQLYKRYNKKVIVLLDEYDTPLQEAYTYGYYDEMAVFIRTLFNNTFKTNDYICRAVLTGITRISRESMFSDMNNVTYAGMTDDLYSAYFGFTEKEVKKALKDQGLSEYMDDVKRWYDGFTIGSVRDIYNPWSITNYLKQREFKAYWANTSSNKLLSEMLCNASISKKKELEVLLNDGSIETEYKYGLSFSTFDIDDDNLWSLLIATGYLKIDSIVGRTLAVSITNYETKELFKDIIKGWFAKERTYYNGFITALLSENVQDMNSYLSYVLKTITSFYDTENFYHGLVLGLLVNLSDRYEIKSNRESGFGRYDISLYPRDKRKDKAYIIEFKLLDSVREKTLDEAANSALNQIEEKSYESDLIDKGISKNRIIKLGIAFEGKRVLVKK